MKKITGVICAAIASLLTIGNVDAQKAVFDKGDFGLTVDYVAGRVSYGGESSLMNGVQLMGEYAFMNVINEKGSISAALILGVEGADVTGVDSYHRFRFATRGMMHYSFAPKFDVYGGINFGFVDVDKWKWEYIDGEGKKWSKSDSDADFIQPSVVAGCRYMFTKNFGVNAEATWDWFQMVACGLTFKF